MGQALLVSSLHAIGAGGRDKGIAGGTEFDAVYAGPDTSAGAQQG